MIDTEVKKGYEADFARWEKQLEEMERQKIKMLLRLVMQENGLSLDELLELLSVPAQEGEPEDFQQLREGLLRLGTRTEAEAEAEAESKADDVGDYVFDLL